MKPLSKLEVKHLTHGFTQGLREVMVLDTVSYIFEQGTSYALAGPSGSGKSTLLHCISGLEEPRSGQVLLDANDLYALSSEQRAHVVQSQIGIMFQVPHLIDELSIRENVMIKGLLGRQDYHLSRKKADYLLERVGLKDAALQRPRSLSGGEQQRVALARTLFCEPSFIIADEPTAHLDEALSRDIMKLLIEYQQEYSAGLIVASHDRLISTMLDRTIVLRDGAVFEDTHMPSSTHREQGYEN